MKKTAVIIVIFLLILMFSAVYAQDAENASSGLPQLLGDIPDPSETLGSLGSLYQTDFVYFGGVYDAYLFPLPDDTSQFVTSYSRQATLAGYEAVTDVIEGYETLRIYDLADESTTALLFYNYQGYMLFMVPKTMHFTLHSDLTEPMSTSRLVELGNAAINAGDYQAALRYLIKAAGEYLESGVERPAGATAVPVNPLPTEVPAITREPGVTQTYVVREGDNCWSIAAQFGLDIRDLMTANNFTECNIGPGDELIIPGEDLQTPTPTPLPGAQQTYVVQAGDNCWTIAVDKFGVNFELFMSVNGMTECNIGVGDEVIIPGVDDQMPTMTPIPLDQYGYGQLIQYPVEMNDSYNDIAAKFNTTLLSIQQLNNVNVYTGFPQYGQVLTIAVNLVTPTPAPTSTPAPEG